MHGKVTIQALATYKPGDRPESIIRNSGGLSAKKTAFLRRLLFVLRCYYTTFMRGRR
jgi:hypothetical protein